MIYKRPEYLKGNISKHLAMRNFIIILASVLFIIASFFAYSFIANIPKKDVIKYRAKEVNQEQLLNTPGGSGGGGGGGGETAVKHTEIFAFAESDPNNSSRYDIFTYDSAKGKKKQLTSAEKDKSSVYTKFNINPKFSADVNTIYFTKAYGNSLEIYSMDLDGENLNSIVVAGKTNFSLLDSRIIYVDVYKNISMFDMKNKESNVIMRQYYPHEYDFPIFSNDGTKIYFVVKRENGSYRIEEYIMTDADVNPTKYASSIMTDANQANDTYQGINRIIHSGEDRITSMEISTDDKFLLLTFGKNFFKIFDIEQSKFIHVVSSDKESSVTGAFWSEDGKSVYWVRNSPYKNIAKLNVEDIKEGMTPEVIVSDFAGYFVSLKPANSSGFGGGSEPETFLYAAISSPNNNCSVIYSHNPTTNTKIQLTGTDTDPNFKRKFWDSYPKYSPDGTMIAFSRTLDDPKSARYIYTMNSDGTDIRFQARTNYFENFSISSDSKTLFFVDFFNFISYIDLETGKIDYINLYESFIIFYPIYVEEPETGSKFVYYVLYDAAKGYYFKRVSLQDHSINEIVYNQYFPDLQTVALSPDSSKLLFSTEASGDTYILDLKTKQLTKNPVVNVVKMPSVFWSNDSKSVYFYLDNPSNMLVKYESDNINAENMVILLDKLPNIYGISLKPPSRNEILFYSEYHSTSKEIVSHNLRTGIKTKLTRNSHDTSPKISPDGKTIVFCRQVDGNRFSFCQMDADGRNLKYLSIFLKTCDFNLSNDGKSIIFKMKTNDIWSLGLDSGSTKNLNVKGLFPAMSFDGKFLYFADGKQLLKKNLTVVGSVCEIVDSFEGEIKDFRLSPDGRYAAVIYSNIVTVISLDPSSGHVFIPIVDSDSPLEDAIWSNDSKWLYLRRGPPKQDLIRISARSNFDISKAEVVLGKLITDSVTQIIPFK